jgi:RNA polymerase sigma-70 factor (ECF subfamily)
VTSEDEKLAALRAGEEWAWAELHREYYPRLWSSVNRTLNSPSQADDVIQEAFVKAHQEISRFQGQSQVGTWLYRIAINKALDFQRKERRRERWISFFSPLTDRKDAPAVPDAPVAPTNAVRLENADLRHQIAGAMAELSLEHRAVVQLRLLDEISLADTARLLHCKEGTVNSRLHYACEHLRRKLKNKVA